MTSSEEVTEEESIAVGLVENAGSSPSVQEEGKRFSIQTSKILKLYRIYAALARLTLGNEGLWSREFPRYLNLRETSLSTSSAQLLQEETVSLSVGG